MKEEWKVIKEFDNYEVSNLGRVRNIKKNKLMTITKRKNGYCVVKLSSNGIAKERKVHRLVALAFIPNPEEYPFINHKDENKENNIVSNLEWCDSLYNNIYGTRTERQSNKIKKQVMQYTKDNQLVRIFNSINEAGEITGIKPCNISNCLCGKQKTAGGYIWTYLST